ncbi:putative permease [Methanocella conradii HZ254]|uniref:Permease n=1 Tax=Methanocella conradii (strain DSM 24694 / JCM 17849 / CGMCC 1.5162 / HZ254) TaxID=1041930 RepID=H8I816_METCZ|nr:DMT family transporter [Methanocella conradii]AFD00834.1 putative permease [Methanocella conradii HZ254]
MPGGERRRSHVPLMLALFAINVFWGGSFVANAIALRSIGPIEIASLRFFLAAPLLLVIAYLWKGKSILIIDKKDLGTLFIMALTGVTIQYIIQVSAQDYTTATNASLLINTSVFFIIFLSAAFLKERLTAWRIIGPLIGFAGVALLVSKGTLSFDVGGGTTGDLLILASAFLWAVYSIYSKRLASRYHTLTILNYVFIIGAIGLIPFYLLTPHAPLTNLPLDAAASILFLALFCSIIAYLVYNMALEKMDASSVALYIYFVPLSTIVLAWLILGESMTIASIGGGLMVLLGMYLAEIEGS